MQMTEHPIAFTGWDFFMCPYVCVCIYMNVLVHVHVYVCISTWMPMFSRMHETSVKLRMYMIVIFCMSKCV